MVLSLLSCLAKADQYGTTFDPLTRRVLTGQESSGDQTCPSFNVIDVSKYPNAKGDGQTDVTPVSIDQILFIIIETSTRTSTKSRNDSICCLIIPGIVSEYQTLFIIFSCFFLRLL